MQLLWVPPYHINSSDRNIYISTHDSGLFSVVGLLVSQQKRRTKMKLPNISKTTGMPQHVPRMNPRPHFVASLEAIELHNDVQDNCLDYFCHYIHIECQ